jgi:hypothetical protein
LLPGETVDFLRSLKNRVIRIRSQSRDARNGK